MKIYFVRHGETNSNLKKTVVSPSDELTQKGIKQAKILAKHFKNIPIDLLLSSPQKRTLQTAKEISKQIGKEITINELLKERKWPNEFEGQSLEDIEVKKFFELLKQKSDTDPKWHFSNEENFSDIKKRVSLFIEYASTLKNQTILAVSHEYFIKLVIAFINFDEKLNYELFRDFFTSTTIDNTSITLCETKDNKWHLVSKSY